MPLTAGTRLVALVTDRRRLAARLRRPEGDAIDLLLSQVEAAAAAGVPLAIVREHDLPVRVLVAIVRHLLARTAQTAMRIVINDRLDVALTAGAHGVHLREQSFTAAHARLLTPARFLVGRSVHDDRAARSAGPVDYLVAGTLFETMSKPEGHARLGLEGLTGVVSASAAPVLAIGGIETADDVRAALRAGASGVAVVGALQPLPDGLPLATGVQNCANRLRSGFDLSS
jgi:thiamine-phosphate diphosphorylase